MVFKESNIMIILEERSLRYTIPPMPVGDKVVHRGFLLVTHDGHRSPVTVRGKPITGH